MTTEMKILRTAADVTPQMLTHAENTADSWFSDADEPIDWEQFIDRFADPAGHSPAGAFDIDSYDNPAIRKIQRHVRTHRKAGA